MSATPETPHQHSWQSILGIYGGEWEPDADAYWCQCGAALVEDTFDGRVIRQRTYTPKCA